MKKIIKSILLNLIQWLSKKYHHHTQKIIDETNLLLDFEILTDTGWATPNKIYKTKTLKVWKVVTKSGKTLYCADTHIVFDKNFHERFVKDLQIGDEILTDRGIDTITSIEDICINSIMYDCELLDYNHRYYTDGILSHNTTTTAIFAAWFTCFHVDKTFAIIANKDFNAQEVYSKLKSIIEYLPFFLKPGCWNFGTVSFSFDNGCKGVYRTATIDALQGLTVDCLFVDEFAYIPNRKIRDFWVNAYPTVSSMTNSKVIIASTPNGKNLYFEIWQDAINRKNSFVPFRVDWWQVPGHDEKWAAQERGNIGAEGFAQQYGLSFDAKMKSLLTAGTFHFLQKIEQKFTPNLFPIGTDWDDKFRWSTQFKYRLSTDWFILSIDIAEGLGLDCSTIKIKRLVKVFEQTGDEIELKDIRIVTVGVFESDTIEINDFAKVIVQLSRKLNLERCRFVVERNTYGDLLFVHIDNICEATRDGYEIPSESFAKFKRKEDSKMEKGLRTNTKIKNVGVSAYQSYMNSKFNIETDSASIEQIREFGDDGNGNYKASVGHDDLVTPEINLSYYIKSNNIGWREFLAEFSETPVDTYNSQIIARIDSDAAIQIANEMKLDNTDIVDNQVNAIDEGFDEYAMASKIAKIEKHITKKIVEKHPELKEVFETEDGFVNALEKSDDEYALAFNMSKKKKKTERKDLNYTSRDVSQFKMK